MLDATVLLYSQKEKEYNTVRTRDSPGSTYFLCLPRPSSFLLFFFYLMLVLKYCSASTKQTIISLFYYFYH